MAYKDKVKKHPNCWKCGETGKITHEGSTWECPDYVIYKQRKAVKDV